MVGLEWYPCCRLKHNWFVHEQTSCASACKTDRYFIGMSTYFYCYVLLLLFLCILIVCLFTFIVPAGTLQLP